MTVSLSPVAHCDLPIFEADAGAYHLFYAPGCVVVAHPQCAMSFRQALLHEAPSMVWAKVLRDHATNASDHHQRQAQRPFAPECLTLYLHNQCNLACAYCYTDPLHHSAPRLDPRIIASAGDVVATHCYDKNLPFTVVFHGGGEPSLFANQVDEALAIIEGIAGRYGLPIFRYIASNGVMSADKARWLASRFDLIGLSCDGTPAIQNRQRPLYGGGGSSASLEHTAHILHSLNKPFHLRITITRQTIHQQSHIVEDVCRRLRPTEIHLEPVYMGGKSDSPLMIDEATAFVDHFIAAQAIAQGYGIVLTCSGSRLNMLHGAYCHVFRDVINLIPEGIATACFKHTRADALQQAGLAIGAYLPETGFMVDHAHIAHLSHALNTLPSACADCFNRFHCTRGCPDSCAVSDTASPYGTFRCHIQQKLATHTILTTATQLWQTADEMVVGKIL